MENVVCKDTVASENLALQGALNLDPCSNKHTQPQLSQEQPVPSFSALERLGETDDLNYALESQLRHLHVLDKLKPGQITAYTIPI